MKKDAFLSNFWFLPIFSKQQLILAAERFGIRRNTLHAYIKRALTRKELIPFKRGAYVTSAFFSKHKSALDYTFSIATKLLEPSYVSRETALQYYGLLTEANNTVITCVTSSTTRSFRNSLGIFEY